MTAQLEIRMEAIRAMVEVADLAVTMAACEFMGAGQPVATAEGSEALIVAPGYYTTCGP